MSGHFIKATFTPFGTKFDRRVGTVNLYHRRMASLYVEFKGDFLCMRKGGVAYFIDVNGRRKAKTKTS